MVVFLMLIGPYCKLLQIYLCCCAEFSTSHCSLFIWRGVCCFII